jgi:hypothetical protein
MMQVVYSTPAVRQPQDRAEPYADSQPLLDSQSTISLGLAVPHPCQNGQRVRGPHGHTRTIRTRPDLGCSRSEAGGNDLLSSRSQVRILLGALPAKTSISAVCTALGADWLPLAEIDHAARPSRGSVNSCYYRVQSMKLVMLPELLEGNRRWLAAK